MPKIYRIGQNTVKRHQPVAALDPLQSQDFPLAHTEALDSIPPVGDTFSLSPDGKWLVVREDNKKTSQENSLRLVVYDIANRRAHFFSPQGDYRVAEDRWLLDSSLYMVDEYHMQRDQKQQIIDASSGQPQLRTLEKAFPSSEKLFSGGDHCPWRNDKGQMVSHRPDRQDRRLIWSADGKVSYSLRAGGSDEYFLVAKRGTETKNLIRHSTKGLRDRMLAEYEKLVTPDNRADFEKFKAKFKKFSPSELFASRFALSPNDRYLYYRISEAGGPMFFGLPDRSIVVDLQSIPVQVWYLNEDPWGTPQWHPNGHDLYFIGKNITTPTDPNFPPMRQPNQWRLSVARFP